MLTIWSYTNASPKRLIFSPLASDGEAVAGKRGKEGHIGRTACHNSPVSCGVRPNGPKVRLTRHPGRKAMPQALARISLHITFKLTNGTPGIEEELLARCAEH
jgi:hypothetical protein